MGQTRRPRPAPADHAVDDTGEQPGRHLVYQAGRGAVDTAVVNGKALKHRGELVGLDLTRARRLAEATRDHFRAGVEEAVWQKFIDPPAAP